MEHCPGFECHLRVRLAAPSPGSEPAYKNTRMFHYISRVGLVAPLIYFDEWDYSLQWKGERVAR